MGGAVFPPWYLPEAKLWRGNEDNWDLLQKVLCSHCCIQCPLPCSKPPLTHASADTCLRQGLLDTHRQVWVSLLWGQCSFLLCPGAHKVLFVPSKSLFPQSCVTSGGSMVGLMVTSSKTAYAIPRSAAPRAPLPVAVHSWPVHRRCSDTVLSQSLWGFWVLVRTRSV